MSYWYGEKVFQKTLFIDRKTGLFCLNKQLRHSANGEILSVIFREARPLKTHHLVFVVFFSRAYCSFNDLVSDSGRWNKYVLCIYICTVIYVVSIMIVMHIEKPFKFEGLIRINFVMNNIQHWLYLFTFIHIECSIVKITIVLWTNYIAWSLKDYSFSESFCLLYQHNLINTIYLKHYITKYADHEMILE